MNMNMIQQLMRLQNIFGNQPNNGPSSQDVVSPTLNGNPTVSTPYINPAMNGYQPADSASRAYSDLLAQYPQQQTPSLARKIGGVLAGFGAGVSPAGYEHGQAVGFHGNPAQAMNVSDAFTNAPHYRDVEEWQNRLKPMQAAAIEEDKSNINKRIAYEQEENRKIAQQKADEAERKNREAEIDNDQKIAISQQRADIAARRAEVYKEIAKGGVIKTDQDGKNWMVYKDGTKTDVGIDSLSPAELQQLKTESALEEIRARTAGQIKVKQTESPSANKPKWVLQQPLDESGKPSGPPVRIDLNTGQVAPTEIGGVLKAPPKAATSSAGTTEQVKEVVKPQGWLGKTLGLEPDKTTTKTTTTKTPVGAQSTGKVMVLSPDGKKGYIPASQLEEALKQGYKKVQ